MLTAISSTALKKLCNNFRLILQIFKEFSLRIVQDSINLMGMIELSCNCQTGV